MSDASETTPAAAHAALSTGEAVLIDVRERSEHDQLRIPGSTLIPLAELADRLGEVPADRDVYVHCRMGARSARAVEFMRFHGWPRAYNVTGGIEAWREAGLPVAG